MFKNSSLTRPIRQGDQAGSAHTMKAQAHPIPSRRGGPGPKSRMVSASLAWPHVERPMSEKIDWVSVCVWVIKWNERINKMKWKNMHLLKSKIPCPGADSRASCERWTQHCKLPRLKCNTSARLAIFKPKKSSLHMPTSDWEVFFLRA